MFTLGQRVNRIEDRDITGAEIAEISTAEDGTTSYRIVYDEGGEGWWPESALEAE